MTRSTRERVRSLTDEDPLRTRDTVPTPTPAFSATLAIVVNPNPLPLVEPVPSNHGARGSVNRGAYAAVRILARHARGVVARWRPLPDLPPILRGRRRRRRRRPPRDHRAPRPPPVAGRRRHLAQPDDALAQRRLGLRRQRLLRGPPGLRRPGDARPADPRGRRARHPPHPRPRPQPHQRPQPLVRRVARLAGFAPPRLVRLGRRRGWRGSAQQLALRLRRRPRLGLRRGERAVLPAQFPALDARPELVERAGPR